MASMLVVRKAQMAALGKAAARQFVDEMIAHLKAFAPRHTARIGTPAVAATVDLGMRRCAGYHFTARGPIRLYLEMMLLFGSHFDTDPQVPWAAGLLRQGDAADQMDRAERLHAETEAYIEAVHGADGVAGLRALEAFAGGLDADMPPSGPAFADTVVTELERCYPEKHAHVGAPALTALAQQALVRAGELEFASERGRRLVFVLMVAFGHRFTEDPLFPWLADDNVRRAPSPQIRASRLEKRMRAYLEAVLRDAGRA